MSNYAEQFAMSKYASSADRSAAMLAELEHLALDLHTERAAVVALTLELANARAVDIHSCHDGCTRSGCVAGRLRAERDALRAELEMRRKSGGPSDRLHNLCEGIADHADGSEWSREEWNRVDKENTDLRAELGSLISQFHHAMKDAGWHPGRTDDNLCDIIRERGKEMAALQKFSKDVRYWNSEFADERISAESLATYIGMTIGEANAAREGAT